MSDNALAMETTGDKISRALQGNQNASKPFRLISDTLRKIAVQQPERLRRMCERMMDKVEQEGDVMAFREIADRIEGKVALQITSTSTMINIDAELLTAAGNLLNQIVSRGTQLEAEIIQSDQEDTMGVGGVK